MDPTRLLKKQHREVESLFKEIQKARNPEQARKLMRELVANLELHMRIEEEMFYPAMREVETKKAEELVLEAYEEHGVAKMVMRELPNVDPEDERFHAKMTVFQELIEHHVEEEEKEMFKIAEKLGAERLQELGSEMEEAFAPEPAKKQAGGRR